MPNPLFLKVMGVGIDEYNTYSSEKKDRFQKLATKRLAQVHESDIEAYTKLTVENETGIPETKSGWEIEEEEKEKF